MEAVRWKLDRQTGLMTKRAAPTVRRPRKRFTTVEEDRPWIGFNAHTIGPNAHWYRTYLTALAKAQELERENDYVIQFLRLTLDSVVGPGFKLRACLKGRTGKPTKAAKAFNEALQHHWQLAAKVGNSPSIEGGQSRRDIERMWLRRLIVDGEVIAVMVPGFDHNKYEFAIKFLDPTQLDHSLNGLLPNGNIMMFGIEVDAEYRRPVRYHFLKHQPTEHLWADHSQAEHEVIEARYVLHTFLKERPGQVRGIPPIAPGAVRGYLIGKLEEALAVGYRVAASKMLFYERTEDYVGDGEDDAGEPDTADEDEYHYKQVVEPGSAEVLPVGVKASSFDPSYPSGSAKEILQALGRGLAASLGGDYTLMFHDLTGTSYGTLRQASLTQRDIYRGWQTFTIQHLVEPHFRQWIMTQRLTGALGLDDAELERLLADQCYRFSGTGFPWIDPEKDAKAMQLALALNLTSEPRLIEDTLGEDHEAILEERKQFRQDAVQADLPLFDALPTITPDKDDDE